VTAALNTSEAAPSAVSHDFSHLGAHKQCFFHFGLIGLRKYLLHIKKPSGKPIHSLVSLLNTI
jgi:hypothetical protein